MWLIDDNTGRVTIDPDAIDVADTATLGEGAGPLSTEMHAAVAWTTVDALPSQVWASVPDGDGKTTTVLADADSAIISILGPGLEPGTFCFHQVTRETGGRVGDLRASLCVGAADGGSIIEWRLGALAMALLVPSVEPVLAANLQRILSDPTMAAEVERMYSDESDESYYDNAHSE